MRFLQSKSKTGATFSNPSQTYSDLRRKSRNALGLLTLLANSVTVEAEPKTPSKDTLFVPADQFEKLLPIDSVEKLLFNLILGQKRSVDNQILDSYGVELAAFCLEQICFRKLEEQWHIAVRLSKGHIPQIDIEHFGNDSKYAMLWADKILDIVRAVNRQQSSKSASSGN
jgi:hypothetical protein